MTCHMRPGLGRMRQGRGEEYGEQGDALESGEQGGPKYMRIKNNGTSVMTVEGAET